MPHLLPPRQARWGDHNAQITAVRGKPGRVYPLRVRLPDRASVKKVKVNGVQQAFCCNDKEIQLDIQFAGDAYVRELDRWMKPDGKPFDFPYHGRQDSLQIKTTFSINKDVAELLEKAKPKNFAEMGQKIASWQADGRGSYSYHNFTCCRPDRLWLILPFTQQRVGEVRVIINSERPGALMKHDRHGHSFYVDITDLVQYGTDNEIAMSMRNLEPNEFMGPFLLYPDEALVSEVLSGGVQATPTPMDKPVVYTRSLTAPGPPRYIQGAKRPTITSARVTGNVTLRSPTQLRVTVDLPVEKIQSVTYAHSGFPWMGKVGIRYDTNLKCWVADVHPGERWRIQESERIFVWAVDRDGLHSDYYPVKVGWDFTQ